MKLIPVRVCVSKETFPPFHLHCATHSECACSGVQHGSRAGGRHQRVVGFHQNRYAKEVSGLSSKYDLQIWGAAWRAWSMLLRLCLNGSFQRWTPQKMYIPKSARFPLLWGARAIEQKLLREWENWSKVWFGANNKLSRKIEFYPSNVPIDVILVRRFRIFDQKHVSPRQSWDKFTSRF